MSSAFKRSAQSGQFTAMREKIAKVATQALRNAAQSSKEGMKEAGKSKKNARNQK